MKKQGGFSLIELLIVVAIILIIAAIAIPNMMESRRRANEASAVSTMHVITTAQIAYSAAYPTLGYADSLSKLGPPPSGNIPDENRAGVTDEFVGCTSQPCRKSSYEFRITVPSSTTPIHQFNAFGTPLGTGGRKGFCLQQLNQVSFDPAGGTACTQQLTS